jgi:hypothetical protein
MTQTRTASATGTGTYTVADIERVVRRVKADLVMIADSTNGWTPAEALNYAHDVDLLATAGYLKHVDVTLLSHGVEVMATCFEVDTDAGGLTSSRPGGVLWPKVPGPFLRIILRYTDDYTASARATMKSRLKVNWSPTDADTSHSTLRSAGGRDYVSNTYGMQRKDWAA